MFERKRAKPLVLHIDDDPDIMGFVRLYLEEIGVDVLSASNAGDGIKMAAAQKPDLVLLDIMMPGTDGFDTCRAIKTKAPGIRVLMLTALGQVKDIEKALANGADGYITKPFTIDKLKTKVNETLKAPPKP